MRSSRSFLEQNLSRFTAVLQDSVFAEEAAARTGWLQNMDPRVKTIGFLLLLLASSFSHSLPVSIAIYSLSVILATGSHVFSFHFFRRVWIFMPFYSALIAFPALFFTPGKTLVDLPFFTITEQGAKAAGFLVTRVATSVSYMFLLVLTTSWPRFLKALRSVGIPRVAVFLISMTYRYIYVLLHTANSLFLARKSRRVGLEAWRSTGESLGVMMNVLLGKSHQLSGDVFLAMQSRGFRGEPVILSDFKMRAGDFGWLTLLAGSAVVAFYFGYWKPI